MSEKKAKEARQEKKVVHTLTIEELADGSINFTGLLPGVNKMFDYSRALEDVIIGKALEAAVVVGEKRGYEKAQKDAGKTEESRIIVP